MELHTQNLIYQTLRQLRESDPAGANPLEQTLEAFRLRLQTLPVAQLGMMRSALMHHIMQEEDLSSRFVLKLMHDVSEAVHEGRRPAYLMPVSTV